MLAVFDFDHTLINRNTDIVARSMIKPFNLIPNRKGRTNWTQYMQQIFNTLKSIKVSGEQVVDVISSISPIEGIFKLMRAMHNNKIDIIIVSDSNSLFINNWLERNKLSDTVVCVYTNPSKIEDGLIKIHPYTIQTTCDQCYINMCKGTIVEKHVLGTNKKYNKILYIGDGQNDLCPVLKLKQNDIAFPRIGYPLEHLLKSNITQSQIIPWHTAEHIYEYLISAQLISNDST